MVHILNNLSFLTYNIVYFQDLSIYLFKVSNGNARAACKICSKLTNERHHSGVFIVNFEKISHICDWSAVSIVDFKQVNASWECATILLDIFGKVLNRIFK